MVTAADRDSPLRFGGAGKDLMTEGITAKPWAALNWPNRISIIRLLLILPFVILLLNQETWAHARQGALLVFVVMAFSDLVDGVLARRLQARTKLGAILDPLADKIMIISAVLLLSLPHSSVPGAVISNWVVVAVVAKDMWVIVGFAVIYLITNRLRIHPTVAGKASTVAQLIMVGLVLSSPEFNAVTPKLGSVMAEFASWAVAGFSVVAIVAYTRLGLGFLVEGGRPLEPVEEADPQKDERD